MTKTCTITAKGLEDIDEIVWFIGQDNVNAAIDMEAAFYDAFDLIAENPAIGHLRANLTDKPYRFWPIKKRYVIIYDESEVPPRIMRVLSGYRDIADILDD